MKEAVWSCRAAVIAICNGVLLGPSRHVRCVWRINSHLLTSRFTTKKRRRRRRRRIRRRRSGQKIMSHGSSICWLAAIPTIQPCMFLLPFSLSLSIRSVVWSITLENEAHHPRTRAPSRETLHEREKWLFCLGPWPILSH